MRDGMKPPQDSRLPLQHPSYHEQGGGKHRPTQLVDSRGPNMTNAARLTHCPNRMVYGYMFRTVMWQNPPKITPSPE